MSGIMARKVGMTRLFAEDGKVFPVTVLEAEPCPVVQVKTPQHDGYSAVQIGYRGKRESRLGKPVLGRLKKVGAPPVSRFKEIPMPEEEISEGDLLDVSMFKPGEKVDVTGFSKGKGFQGNVKRHGQSGGDATHGTKQERGTGAIGQCATPSKVWKNRKMPGHAGNRKVTVRNLEVMEIDTERNLLVLKGSVPGARNGYILVRKHRLGRA